MTQYCVLSSHVTSVGYVGNVICLKFVQESFKVLFEKELVKNMMYLMWELNPRLSVHDLLSFTLYFSFHSLWKSHHL